LLGIRERAIRSDRAGGVRQEKGAVVMAVTVTGDGDNGNERKGIVQDHMDSDLWV
jgi:hypothetical protein